MAYRDLSFLCEHQDSEKNQMTKIEITDNMRLWALSLYAARKKNQEEYNGFSDAIIDALSIQDACKATSLTQQELDSIRELIKQNRLGELAS